MPRKTLGGYEFCAGPYYRDNPECVARYEWLVKDSLKKTEKMFNLTSNPKHVCKVCGGKTTYKDFEAHVLEHARQLKLKLPPAKITQSDADGNIVWEDYEPGFDTELLKETVWDAILARNSEPILWTEDGFEKKLTDILVSAIVVDITEQDGVEPVFCVDCQD